MAKKPKWKAPAATSSTDTGAFDPDAKRLRHVNLIVTLADHKRLRTLGIEREKSLQKLGIEAWNLILEKEGLEPLDPQPANTKGRRKGA